MTPFEELRVSCVFTDTDIVESESNFRIWSACWREATSTGKSPEHISLVDVTMPTLSVMTFWTKKGGTLAILLIYTFYDEFFKILIRGLPTEGRLTERTHASFGIYSSPDGPTHHRV
ncbi:hypothetical protein AVEN_17100-1 [Araneus ventricosus]|uniref:Uncharacterized protein n=1 Tax=Araneus ventricosus TaxID=182803 RepID=A0A4Y2TZN6_ARAVE|nr:hypothetical protein AVEN_17100-1 [Araneus ventricosus]